MLTAIAGWSIRHPWKAIAAWLLLVVAATALAGAVPQRQVTDADYAVGESGRASAMLKDAGIREPQAENVLVTAPGGGAPDTARAKAAVAELTRRWSAQPTVARVHEPVPSPKDGTLLVSAELKAAADETSPDVSALQSDVASVNRANPGVTLRQSGSASTSAAIQGMVDRDLQRAELTSLPVTLLIMLLVFGALIAAGIPVLVGLTSVAIAMGLLGPLSQLVPMDPSVGSMVVLLGMAVGVDYSLFYLQREREERRAGATTADAVRVAAATSGHSIVVSGVAVVVALAGLFIMDFAAFDALAAGATAVVAIAVTGSLTVLPAVLARLGRWVDRPRIPFLHRLGPRGGVTGRVLRPVVRHPLAALLAGLAVAATLAAPALSLRTAPGSFDSLPRDIPEVATYAAIRDSFPQQGTPAEVVVRAGGQTPAQLRAVAADAAAHGWSPAGPPRTEGGVTVLPLATRATPGSAQLLADVDALRAAANEHVTSEHAVGGSAGWAADMVHHLDDRMPLAIVAVLLLTSLMMALAFRSVAVGVVTSLLNLASVGVAFGVLAAVFQSAWGARLLGFTHTGAVRDWVPMFLFSVLVGLSMDYHVFVLSRVRENVRGGMGVREAVEHGIGRTAGVVTSAAVVMVSVFAIFATLGLAEMKQIGVGLAVAIAVDATLVRLVLLPSMLALLGRRAWWPGRVAPANPRDAAAPALAPSGAWS